MANRLTTWVDGNTLTAATLNAEFDNIYTGTVDRTAGRWGANDDIPVVFGSSQDCSIAWNTTQTQDALVIGLGASRTIIICDEADKTTNFAYGAASHPSLFLHSANATAAEYLQVYHDGTHISFVNGTVGAFYFKPTLAGGGTATISINGTQIGTVARDFGDGEPGWGIVAQRNSNATNQGAGHVALVAKDGTQYYIWVDAAGKVRVHTAAPSTANDVAGTIIGTQTA